MGALSSAGGSARNGGLGSAAEQQVGVLVLEPRGGAKADVPVQSRRHR